MSADRQATDESAVPLSGKALARHAAILALVLVIGAALVAGYLTTQTPVTLAIDGDRFVVGTHQTTVAAVLRDNGVILQPEDLVAPPLDAQITPGLSIAVERAHHVTVQVDGQVLETRTREHQPRAILEQMGVRVGPADWVIVDGQPLPTVPPDGTAPGGGLMASAVLIPGASGFWQEGKGQPELIEVRRAVPLVVNDAGTLLTFETTQPTVGEALHAAGVVLYLGDRVQPPLWTRVSAGLTVEIRRSVPLAILVDGHTIHTRTFRGSVGEVLADTGVALVGEDYCLPTADSAVTPDISIQIVRVRVDIATEQENIAYEEAWQGDPELEIDNQRIAQYGELGVRQRRTRVRYENGLEVSRVLEDEWVLKEPVTQIYAYGTQIVVRTLETPYGTIEYWRKIPMLATSYSASTAGTPRSAPWYGRTAVGWPMQRGIVAVDPRVIPLLSQVYVPGYGIGTAADTGSAIKNRRIDLGYDDDNLLLWYTWVEVYVLTPVPDPSKIQYVLGNWPPTP